MIPDFILKKMSTRDYILYLEPDPSEQLSKSIMDFYNESKDVFGPNEAHQYHPHVSLTGFWQMDDEIVH